MASNKKDPSVWEVLNEPVGEVSEGVVKPAMAVAAAVLLFAWVMPYFGSADNAVYQTAYGEGRVAGAMVSNYVGLFEPIEAAAYTVPQVAGAITEAESVDSSVLYDNVSAVSNMVNEVYNEAVVEPFAEAATEVLDISEQVQPMIEFYEPGVDAAVEAWLQLMAEPLL